MIIFYYLIPLCALKTNASQLCPYFYHTFLSLSLITSTGIKYLLKVGQYIRKLPNKISYLKLNFQKTDFERLYV
jgi:hypothetical protein